MGSVLLIILKIIGITLLVIICLILLLLLLVLFVPVRYRFKGSYDEKFLCRGKVTWLLHLVSIRIDVEDKAVTTIRILGIPLSVFLKKKDKVEETTSEKVSEEKTTMVTDSAKLSLPAGQTEKAEMDKISVTVDSAGDIPEHLSDESMAETLREQPANDLPVEEKHTVFNKISSKIQAIIQKIRDLIDKIKSIFAKIKDTIINVKEKKETLKRYLAIVRSDTAKAAFALCKKRIFQMLKHIFPRKMRVNLTYGMNDPADTGYILAVYGMLPEFVGKRVVLHADFDNPVLKGDFYVKGGIRAWTLLYQVICVLLDKNCQRLYHIVKKEIANERKQ